MHDPCQHSKGKRITKRSRPHRRRSNSSSFGKAKAPKATKESNQSQFMSEDSLEFCDHREKSMPQSACEIRPLNAQNLSSKGSSPTFIKSDSRNEGKRQTALAVDTRFVETLRDTGLPQNIIQNIQTLLDKAELRGVAPSVMSISQPHLTQKSLSGIRVHSYSPCMTSKKRAGLEPIYIPTETLEMANLEKQETTNSTGVVVQLPKLFSAKASWKLFGDYGTWTNRILLCFLNLNMYPNLIINASVECSQISCFRTTKPPLSSIDSVQQFDSAHQ